MNDRRLGLRENLPQFALLVVLNAFVGAMVGLERTVLPLLGESGNRGRHTIDSLFHAHAPGDQ